MWLVWGRGVGRWCGAATRLPSALSSCPHHPTPPPAALIATACTHQLIVQRVRRPVLWCGRQMLTGTAASSSKEHNPGAKVKGLRSRGLGQAAVGLPTLISSYQPVEPAVLDTLAFLRHHCITDQQIERIHWILLQSPQQLKDKLHLITKPFMFRTFGDGLGFCRFSCPRLVSIHQGFKREKAAFPQHRNRVYYLADKLQLPVDRLTEKMAKIDSMIRMSMDNLDKMLSLLCNYGMAPEDILSDLWVFSYSPEKAEARLEQVTQLGVRHLKPWMCRCPDHVFDRYCEQVEAEARTLGPHTTIVDFLAAQLHCQPSLLEEAFSKNKILRAVKATRLQSILDMFLEEGLSPEEVRSCLKVFQYSKERSHERIQQLKSVGYFPFPLVLLTMTPAQFQKKIIEHRRKTHHMPPR